MLASNKLSVIGCFEGVRLRTRSSDIPKTAVSTPFGLFEFTKTTFGLRNAAQSFQRFMHSVLLGRNFTFVYLEDKLIASKTFEEHLEHLEIVLKKLSE